MEAYQDTFWLSRLLLQRGMALMYLMAFLSTLRQFPALLGENGLLPVPDFLKRREFKTSPSLFHFHYSDRFLRAVCWLGITLSVLALLGLTEAGPIWLSVLSWLTMWVLYLSIVNVGQTFYGFGWESMILEAGFFTAFLGPAHTIAPAIPVLLLRWMLFRVELGAGLIKLRHDKCWRDLTCLLYHYETQPMPNRFSRRFHHLPAWFHKASVAGSHLVQLVVPFGLFGPPKIATLSACAIIFHQGWLVVSGNYSWLNWLTIVLGFSGLSDRVFGFSDQGSTLPLSFQVVLWTLGLATLALSIEPTKNFFSEKQRMNCSYNPLKLVNSYGAFGSVTKQRYEIVLEGTGDEFLSSATQWKEYAFRGKPGDPRRHPRQFAPYHLRLDWQMWFLPFTARVMNGRVRVFGRQAWFFQFIKKLLQGDKATLQLLQHNPFPEAPPRYLRARYYLYRFSTEQELRENGLVWVREPLGNYLEPCRVEEL